MVYYSRSILFFGEEGTTVNTALLSKVLSARIQEIRKDSQLHVLTQLDEPSGNEPRVTQYVAYTDFSADQQQKQTASIYVFTPYKNLDNHNRAIIEYQTQLMFNYDPWQKTMHISVLETLGAASSLAFFDYQNHGLATVALKGLIGLARRNGYTHIDGVVSSFDGVDDLLRISDLFQKVGFSVQTNPSNPHVGEYSYALTK